MVSHVKESLKKIFTLLQYNFVYQVQIPNISQWSIA